VSVCPPCGHGNQGGVKFCSECGAALVPAPPLVHEERKVVTVLFADLVGFTSPAEQMDPEDVRAGLSPFDAMGAARLAAMARFRAAQALWQEGRMVEAEAQLRGALDFFWSVGATRFIHEGEALLAALA
jgi:hypothetical protein